MFLFMFMTQILFIDFLMGLMVRPIFELVLIIIDPLTKIKLIFINFVNLSYLNKYK